MQALSLVHVDCARSTLARPAAAWSLYLGCMYNEAPPLGPWRNPAPAPAPALALLLLASGAPPSYLIPPAATACRTSQSSSSFAFFAFSSSLPPLPLRFDAKLHASNRITPVAASGHAIAAAEPFAIPDFHHRLSRSQPQPHPPSSDKFLVLDCLFCSCRGAVL